MPQTNLILGMPSILIQARYDLNGFVLLPAPPSKLALRRLAGCFKKSCYVVLRVRAGNETRHQNPALVIDGVVPGVCMYICSLNHRRICPRNRSPRGSIPCSDSSTESQDPKISDGNESL